MISHQLFKESEHLICSRHITSKLKSNAIQALKYFNSGNYGLRLKNIRTRK